MERTLLEVKDLSFAYEEKQVLNKISFAVQRGEKVAVMGSNGAGKSTFFLNLNGVLQADSGEIFLEGKRIGKKDFLELRKRVGFVFQDADSQMIASNVRAEISFGPMNMGLGNEVVRQRVDEVVQYLALKDLEEKAPHYLSGGEKKRVSIADILAMKPDVLIFDEPMAALDPVNAEKVEGILERLHEEGRTLIIATHDVDFAYRFADRIVVFCDGSLIADEEPAVLFRKEEIMRQAHLRKPAMLEVWEALSAAGIVPEREGYPLTSKEAAKKIAHIAQNATGTMGKNHFRMED